MLVLRGGGGGNVISSVRMGAQGGGTITTVNGDTTITRVDGMVQVSRRGRVILQTFGDGGVSVRGGQLFVGGFVGGDVHIGDRYGDGATLAQW